MCRWGHQIKVGRKSRGGDTGCFARHCTVDGQRVRSEQSGWRRHVDDGDDKRMRVWLQVSTRNVI